MPKQVLIVGYSNDPITNAQREPFDDYRRDLLKALDLSVEQVYAESFLAAAEICQKTFAEIVFFLPSWREEASQVEAAVKDIRAARGDRPLFFVDPFAQTSSKYFGVLPYVDALLKRQRLRDLDLYQRSLAGGTVFTDYLTKHFHLDLNGWEVGSPVAPGYEHRITTGWSLGTARRFREALNGGILPGFRRPKKDIDVFCRLSLGSQQLREWYCEYRIAAVEALKPLASDYRTIAQAGFTETSQFVPPHQYLQELKRSKIVFSPFGWGESCWRDFEAICYNCLLIKPAMDHVVIEPNIFVDGETYVAVKWDFSDLEEKCRYYLEHPAEMARIIANARQVYASYFEQKKFVQTIGRILSTSLPHMQNSSSAEHKPSPLVPSIDHC